MTDRFVVLVALAAMACGGRGPGFAELEVQLAVAPGVEPPEGSAVLTRGETSGDLGPGGEVLIPAVSERRIGRIRFGETRRVAVPEGVVGFEVVGFEPSGQCAGSNADDLRDSGGCFDAGWEGDGAVWVSDEPLPEGRGELPEVRSGETGILVIEVREGCMCTD